MKASIAWALFVATWLRADCVPYSEAAKHVGERLCVSGTIERIDRQKDGVTLLDFCVADGCPFKAVVFAHDLRQVGDVSALQGKSVEIHGSVKEYRDHAEIIVSDARQLGGKAAKLPPLPKTYDVEQRGHYSAGKFSLPHASNAKKPKKQAPKYPVDTFDPERD